MTPPAPSPDGIIGLLSAYQRSAIMKAAIDLDVFTAIGAGVADIDALSVHCDASRRGMRALVDSLVVLGVLRKRGETYALTRESAAFLDRASARWIGPIDEFLLHPELVEYFHETVDAVRNGGRLEPRRSLATDAPAWRRYAETMGTVMTPTARAVADVIEMDTTRPCRLLDIGAGHGMFGIAMASRNPRATVVANDWPSVLEVARRNAAGSGIADRFAVLPGDARTVDIGGGFDLILLANVLHQFDPESCLDLLRRVRASLNPRGRVVTVEYVPNDDRVSSPAAVMFEMTMLVTTPTGRLYTFQELDGLFCRAGFARSDMLMLPSSSQRAVVSHLGSGV